MTLSTLAVSRDQVNPHSLHAAAANPTPRWPLWESAHLSLPWYAQSAAMRCRSITATSAREGKGVINQVLLVIGGAGLMLAILSLALLGQGQALASVSALCLLAGWERKRG
ncbi:hypothetical protein [Vreelandella maris]|uniref:hypothetical protein n=1 Tax=Vreelandella maris TaxID=2729617 RepID=UPI0030EBD2EF